MKSQTQLCVHSRAECVNYSRGASFHCVCTVKWKMITKHVVDESKGADVGEGVFLLPLAENVIHRLHDMTWATFSVAALWNRKLHVSNILKPSHNHLNMLNVIRLARVKDQTIIFLAYFTKIFDTRHNIVVSFGLWYSGAPHSPASWTGIDCR